MNFFGDKTFTFCQVGILKLSVLCFGLAVGSHWPDIFSQLIPLLVVICAVAGLYIVYVWVKESRAPSTPVSVK